MGVRPRHVRATKGTRPPESDERVAGRVPYRRSPPLLAIASDRAGLGPPARRAAPRGDTRPVPLLTRPDAADPVGAGRAARGDLDALEGRLGRRLPHRTAATVGLGASPTRPPTQAQARSMRGRSRSDRTSVWSSKRWGEAAATPILPAGAHPAGDGGQRLVQRRAHVGAVDRDLAPTLAEGRQRPRWADE